MVRYFGFGERCGERFLVHRGLVCGIARETLEFSNKSDVIQIKEMK